MSKYQIEESSLTNLADGVRWRTGGYDPLSVANMISGLKKDYGVNREHEIDICTNDEWVRPSGLPDLDSLNLQMSGDDFIYMTYDATGTGNAIVWHIETANKAAATLDIGHISNGSYIVDETYSVTHNTDFIKWTDNYSGYLVIRITGQITYCYSKSTTLDGQTQHYRQQPIIERIAYVPHLIKFCPTANSNAWTMYSQEREKVANGDGTALTSINTAWGYGRNLRSLDISGIHTPNVTDMANAFYFCQYIKELDLRHWVTTKVLSLSSTFSTCYGLRTINITGWETPSLNNLYSTFSTCRSLKKIYGLEGLNTANVTTFAYLFSVCMNLDDFPIEDWDTAKCTTFVNLFNECYMLKEIDLSGWDTSKVTTFASMFSNCQSLKRVCLDGWSAANVTTVSGMFSSCHDLESIDISWMHLTNKCTSIYAMFSNCWLIKEINIPNDWDLSGIGNGSNTANNTFSNCYSLEKITGISNWQFSFTNALNSMFSNCRSLKTIDVSGWKTNTVTNLSSMFYYCYSLEEIDLTNWSTDNCTNLSSMFNGCWSLKRIIGNLSAWDTSNVTNFSYMFSDCWSLETFPPAQSWDFSSATTVASMFNTMTSIEEITLTNINLPLCTTVATMFRYCRALKKVTLTGWSIPKVTSTAPAQFLGDCPNLKDVTISIPFALNLSFSGDEALTHESLLNIINSLPTVATARTLNLMNQNINRLTAAEKQIATSKNWTLAN